MEGLYYVDVKKGTPKVSEYTQVVEDFYSRILAVDTLDEQFHTLHVDFLDKNGELDAQESIDLDLTHNGYKEKVVTKVYLEEENENLTEALHKAGNWGTVEVYEYLVVTSLWMGQITMISSFSQGWKTG